MSRGTFRLIEREKVFVTRSGVGVDDELKVFVITTVSTFTVGDNLLESHTAIEDSESYYVCGKTASGTESGTIAKESEQIVEKAVVNRRELCVRDTQKALTCFVDGVGSRCESFSDGLVIECANLFDVESSCLLGIAILQ